MLIKLTQFRLKFFLGSQNKAKRMCKTFIWALFALAILCLSEASESGEGEKASFQGDQGRPQGLLFFVVFWGVIDPLCLSSSALHFFLLFFLVAPPC
jgi:hypothetical protein